MLIGGAQVALIVLAVVDDSPKASEAATATASWLRGMETPASGRLPNSTRPQPPGGRCEAIVDVCG